MSMQETVQDGIVATLIAKFLPAGIGAAIMIAFDPPKTKRDLFIRAFVAFASSYLFGDAAFDWLDSLPFFSFLETSNPKHHTAVDGLVGAFGFFVMGGLAEWFKRFRKDPTGAVNDLPKR